MALYSYALDTGVREGRMFAELFTPDGAFVSPVSTIEGRDKLSAFAAGVSG